MTDARTLLLRIIGVTGAAAFGFFFFLTIHTPRWIEDFGRSYIEGKVLERVDQAIESVAAPQGGDVLSRYAARLFEKNELEIERFREFLKQGARDRLAECIATLVELTDDQREALRQLLDSGARWQIAALEDMNAKLVGIIQQGYLGVVAELKRDVRIFTAVNAFAFLLLLVVSFLKPEHIRALFVPGLLLAMSTLLCAWLYVFEQNWLLTIIQGSYLGLAYAAWLLVVFLLLCDVWLNRARVTLRIVDAMSHGLATVVSP